MACGVVYTKLIGKPFFGTDIKKLAKSKIVFYSMEDCKRELGARAGES